MAWYWWILIVLGYLFFGALYIGIKNIINGGTSEIFDYFLWPIFFSCILIGATFLIILNVVRGLIYCLYWIAKGFGNKND
jgi:hypothetical protein